MYDITHIKNIYEKHIPKSINKLKEVTVMIALMNIKDSVHILFERRSGIVGQSGDISFIGGHIDDGETPIQAVIREAKEECNIDEKNIKVLGESDYLINFNALKVHVFVCEIVGVNFDDIKCNEEVDEIIAIKIDDIIDKDYRKYISSIEVIRGDDFPYYLIENQKNYKFFSGKEVTYFYEFENCVIWGMTAKILNNFIKTLKDE